MDKVGFGKKLKELRLNKGQSQGNLATEMSLNVKQVQRYETGEVLPTHENVEWLCKYYEYDFVSLLYELKGTTNQPTLFTVKDMLVDAIAVIEKLGFVENSEFNSKTSGQAFQVLEETDKASVQGVARIGLGKPKKNSVEKVGKQKGSG